MRLMIGLMLLIFLEILLLTHPGRRTDRKISSVQSIRMIPMGPHETAHDGAGVPVFTK
jgi:hypothetical protein